MFDELLANRLFLLTVKVSEAHADGNDKGEQDAFVERSADLPLLRGESTTLPVFFCLVLSTITTLTQDS